MQRTGVNTLSQNGTSIAAAAQRKLLSVHRSSSLDLITSLIAPLLIYSRPVLIRIIPHAASILPLLMMGDLVTRKGAEQESRFTAGLLSKTLLSRSSPSSRIDPLLRLPSQHPLSGCREFEIFKFPYLGHFRPSSSPRGRNSTIGPLTIDVKQAAS